MKPKDFALGAELQEKLVDFAANEYPLPGVPNNETRGVLIEQLLESVHRVRYVPVLKERSMGLSRADPNSTLFDPLKAAILALKSNHRDEAYWLLFLFVYFGKNRKGGWRLARDVYGALGAAHRWDWKTTSANPHAFAHWLAEHEDILRGADGARRGFGNHRKFESLKSTGAAVTSYVEWVGQDHVHDTIFGRAMEEANGDPRKSFEILYGSMDQVQQFGRTAKFDYLSMIGKLGLAPIEPGSAYLQGATGPLRGARLLLGGDPDAQISPRELQNKLSKLEQKLGLFFGMQILEDALCNWQKSPGKFIPFRG